MTTSIYIFIQKQRKYVSTAYSFQDSPQRIKRSDLKIYGRDNYIRMEEKHARERRMGMIGYLF